VKNFYSILDVSPDATKDQIKLQYRKLVREFHPDQFLEPHIKQHYEEKLKEVNEAYTNVTKATPPTEPFGTVKPRYTQQSPLPVFLGIASLSTLIFFIITLFPIFAMGLSETTLSSPQVQEIEIDALDQPVVHQEDMPSKSINHISTTNVHTPKLGTTVLPIDPLRRQAMFKDRN